MVSHAYQPGQPDSLAVALEDKGPRLRLIFEDNAPPYNPLNYQKAPDSASDPLGDNHHLLQLQQLADSVIYYRSPDHKNRLVVFMS